MKIPMTKADVMRHQEELQKRILEAIQDFEMETDWRVRAVIYDPVAAKVSTTVVYQR